MHAVCITQTLRYACACWTLLDFSDHCENMAPNLLMIIVIIVTMIIISLLYFVKRRVSQERSCRGITALTVAVVFI